MNVKEFARIWRAEKDLLLKMYSASSEETAVSKMIQELQLNNNGIEKMKQVLDCVLTDTFYTFLMGLDGAASIGGVQQDYKVYDENDTLIFESGDLEAEAYEQFHEL